MSDHTPRTHLLIIRLRFSSVHTLIVAVEPQINTILRSNREEGRSNNTTDDAVGVCPDKGHSFGHTIKKASSYKNHINHHGTTSEEARNYII